VRCVGPLGFDTTSGVNTLLLQVSFFLLTMLGVADEQVERYSIPGGKLFDVHVATKVTIVLAIEGQQDETTSASRLQVCREDQLPGVLNAQSLHPARRNWIFCATKKCPCHPGPHRSSTAAANGTIFDSEHDTYSDAEEIVERDNFGAMELESRHMVLGA